jgi:hypothetical protein
VQALQQRKTERNEQIREAKQSEKMTMMAVAGIVVAMVIVRGDTAENFEWAERRNRREQLEQTL